MRRPPLLLWAREVLAVLFPPLPPQLPNGWPGMTAARQEMLAVGGKPRCWLRKTSFPGGFAEKKVASRPSSNTRWHPPNGLSSTSRLHPRTCSTTATCPARMSCFSTQSRATASGWRTQSLTSALWAPAPTMTTLKCPARPVSVPRDRSRGQSRSLLKRPAWMSLMQTVPKVHTLCSHNLAQTARPVPKQGEPFGAMVCFGPHGLLVRFGACLLETGVKNPKYLIKLKEWITQK